MRRFVATSAIALTALLGTTLEAVPAIAATASWNTTFTPTASADGAAITPHNAPDVKWAAGTGDPTTAPTARSSAKPAIYVTKSAAVQPVLSTQTVAPPGLGELPYFGFDKTELSLDDVAQVNLGNGNLLLTASDGILNGAGLSLRNDRFYNSLSTGDTGAFGAGWSSSLSQTDVGLEIGATSATFHGDSGFTAKFTLSGSTYTAPSGFNGTLTADSTSTSKAYTLQYNSSGEKLTFSNTGYLTTDTDRNGAGSSYSYNSDGQLFEIFTASGRHYTVNWVNSTSNRIATIQDSAGRTVSYQLNSADQLTKVTKPDNDTEEYTYNSAGLVATAEYTGTSHGDIVFSFAYDSARRITALSSALLDDPNTVLSSTTYAYSSGQTTVTDGRGNTTTYSVDSAGRITKTVDALGHSHATTWTSGNNVETNTDALGSSTTAGNTTTYSYDSLNNSTGVTYPSGAAASATYAQGSSQAQTATDDAGNETSISYDPAGNATSLRDTTSNGTGVTTNRYTYENSQGSVCGGIVGQRCTSTDGDGNTTSYAYNSSGDLISINPPGVVRATTYQYDSLGRVTSVTDGNGFTTSYSYTAKDQIRQVQYSNNGGVITTDYYQNGLAQDTSDSNGGTQNAPGKTQNITYDGLGRILTQTGPTSESNQSYTYDKVGNIRSYTDANGTVDYSYDAVNELTQSVEPGGTCTSGDASPAVSSGCVKYEYDANGNETQRLLPGGAVIKTRYDNDGRAIRITATDASAAVVADIGYSYGVGGSTAAKDDRLNVQQSIAYKEVGVAAGAITTYTYDSLNRLTKAVEKSDGSTTASWTYTYDANGNRTTQQLSGTTGETSGSISYTYNAANEITSTSADTANWTYDQDGSLLTNGITGQTATYNSRSDVATIGGSTYAAFGATNAGVLSRVGVSSTTTYSEGINGLASESTGSDTTTAYTRTPGGDLVGARTATFGDEYYVEDSLGSIIGIFGSDGEFKGGYSYAPFGATRAVSSGAAVVANTLRYVGGYWDDTVNLYHLGARYYDPTTGRFTQPDPTGQEANPYAYAKDDPINNADPEGTLSKYLKDYIDYLIEAALVVAGALIAPEYAIPFGLVVISRKKARSVAVAVYSELPRDTCSYVESVVSKSTGYSINIC